jgi:(p)ppGpp synthase/HD superfamily hydrolase
MRSVQNVLDAALFAAQKHAGQRRKGQAAEPYVNHLIEVARLVSMAIPERKRLQIEHAVE